MKVPFIVWRLRRTCKTQSQFHGMKTYLVHSDVSNVRCLIFLKGKCSSMSFLFLLPFYILVFQILSSLEFTVKLRQEPT